MIADVHLPYLNGIEFASILLADLSLPSIRIVLISAHEHYRDRAEALGAAFLHKPILKDTLLETIEKALSEGARRPEGRSAPASAGRESVRQATLRRARDLAGGVSYLGRSLGVGVHALDAMIHGNEETPQWVFLRAAEFVSRAEEAKTTPPGLPADWDDPRWSAPASA